MAQRRKPQVSALDAAERRRKKLHRRHVIAFFSVVSVLLAATGVAIAIVLQWIPAPSIPFHDPDASSSPSVDTNQPCPPEDAIYSAPADIWVNVYNATSRTGIAAQTGEDLASRGFNIVKTENAKVSEDSGVAIIRTGESGVAAAYTLAEQLNGAVIKLDTRTTDDVDLVIVSNFSGLRPALEVPVLTGQVIVPLGACQPLS